MSRPYECKRVGWMDEETNLSILLCSWCLIGTACTPVVDKLPLNHAWLLHHDAVFKVCCAPMQNRHFLSPPPLSSRCLPPLSLSCPLTEWRLQVGLAGRTGAGKSSILSALLRLRAVSSGAILLDGADVARVPLPLLRSSVAVLPQTPFLFQATVRQGHVCRRAGR